MRLLRVAITSLVFCLPLLAQRTTVTDTMYDGAGNLARGNIILVPVRQFTSGSVAVYPVPVITQITNGVFSISLYPTDSGVPANMYYIANISIRGNRSTVEYWVIPTSGSPVGLSTVRSTPASLLTLPISLAQLTCSGCFQGQSLVVSAGNLTNGVEGRTCAFVAATSVVCTHNLNSLGVGVDVFDNVGREIIVDVDLTSFNSVTITLPVATTGTVVVK